MVFIRLLYSAGKTRAPTGLPIGVFPPISALPTCTIDFL